MFELASVGVRVEAFECCEGTGAGERREGERSVGENGIEREDEDADALVAGAEALLDAEGALALGVGLPLRDAAAAAALARAASERLIAFMFAVNFGAGEAEAPAAVAVEQSCVLGKRCCGQNCCLQVSHLIGEYRTLLHFRFAQVGFFFTGTLPVMTSHSLVKCLSIRMLGSCPGGMAIGVLHSGH